jgi:hypothetical protein
MDYSHKVYNKSEALALLPLAHNSSVAESLRQYFFCTGELAVAGNHDVHSP